MSVAVIVLSSLLLLFLKSLWIQAGVAFFLLIAPAGRKTRLSGAMIVVFSLTLCFHLLVRFDEAWFQGFSDRELWVRALYFSLRNLNLLLLMSLLLHHLRQSDPGRTLISLEKRLAARGVDAAPVLRPFFIALMTWDIFRDEYQSLQQLHRILGLELPRNRMMRIKYYSGLILPLISAALDRSESLGIALTSRGYGAAHP